MKHPTVTHILPADIYLIAVPRGLHGQRRRRVALTPEEARIVLAQLVGELRQRTDIPRKQSRRAA